MVQVAAESDVPLLTWLETLPTPDANSQWDAIFLVPAGELDFAVLLAWYYRTHIDPKGECHEEFLNNQ